MPQCPNDVQTYTVATTDGRFVLPGAPNAKCRKSKDKMNSSLTVHNQETIFSVISPAPTAEDIHSFLVPLAFISRPSWTAGSFLEETPRGRHDDDVVGRSTMIRQHVALRRRPDLSLSLSCREAAWTGFCVSHLMHWASLLTRPSQSEELSFNEDMNLWKIKVARTMRSQTLYLVLLSREESHAFRHFSYRLLFF